MMEEFLNVLFNKNEQTCFSKNCYNVDLNSKPLRNDIFFSINPMQTSRADANVTCFRNFLIELDNMPLEKQIAHVTSKLPADLITSIVYSGSKSYHFIISLETPMNSIDEYRNVAKRLHTLFPEADSTSKNPSRFSRLPFRIRPDTKVEQSLIRLNGRIDTKAFLSALPIIQENYIQQNIPATKAWISTNLTYALEQPDEYMAERGFAGRNHFFFYVYNRLIDEGFQGPDIKHYIDYMYSRLKNKKDFTIAEAYTAARIK